MKTVSRLLTTVCAIILLPGATLAASSEWLAVQGGRVRIVTSGVADEHGMLRGALDIELRPGWKTYWRDPGDAGVPPTVDVSRSVNVEAAELEFPAPQRHAEADYTWAGYGRPVAFPINFKLSDVSKNATIEADVFLGICQEICIPVQGALKLEPASGPDDAADIATVAAAFNALPAPAHEGFRAKAPVIEGDEAVFEVETPPDTKAIDLFLAAAEGYYFATPQKIEKDGRTFFKLKATRPEKRPASGVLYYTLVGDTGSVNGTLPYF